MPKKVIIEILKDKRKNRMKKSFVFHIILLYLAQLSVSVSVILFFKNVANKICSAFLCAGIGLYAIATILGFVIMALSATTINNPQKISYKFIMVSKLILIPYFVINFVQCFLLIAGFLNPFLFLSLIVIVPMLIGLTYISMLPTTIASTFLTISSVSNKKIEFEKIIVWQVLEYLFVIDVISSVIIYCKFKKCLN